MPSNYRQHIWLVVFKSIYTATDTNASGKTNAISFRQSLDRFSANSAKEDSVLWLPDCYLEHRIHYEKELILKGKKLPFRMDPFQKESRAIFDWVVSPEIVSIPLKLISPLMLLIIRVVLSTLTILGIWACNWYIHVYLLIMIDTMACNWCIHVHLLMSVTYNRDLLTIHIRQLGGSVEYWLDWWSGGCELDPCQVGNILSWRLVMKYFLRSFSPFRWFKKGSSQFRAKDHAKY